jgi:hypothetical protein
MHTPLEFFKVKGLGKIVVGAKAHSLFLSIGSAERGNQNNIDIAKIAPNRPDQIQPIHPRHIHVGDHQVATMTLEHFDCRHAIFGFQNDISAVRKQELVETPGCRIILDDQHRISIVAIMRPFRRHRHTHPSIALHILEPLATILTDRRDI